MTKSLLLLFALKVTANDIVQIVYAEIVFLIYLAHSTQYQKCLSDVEVNRCRKNYLNLRLN